MTSGHRRDGDKPGVGVIKPSFETMKKKGIPGVQVLSHEEYERQREQALNSLPGSYFESIVNAPLELELSRLPLAVTSEELEDLADERTMALDAVNESLSRAIMAKYDDFSDANAHIVQVSERLDDARSMTLAAKDHLAIAAGAVSHGVRVWKLNNRKKCMNETLRILLRLRNAMLLESELRESLQAGNFCNALKLQNACSSAASKVSRGVQVNETFAIEAEKAIDKSIEMIEDTLSALTIDFREAEYHNALLGYALALLTANTRNSTKGCETCMEEDDLAESKVAMIMNSNENGSSVGLTYTDCKCSSVINSTQVHGAYASTKQDEKEGADQSLDPAIGNLNLDFVSESIAGIFAAAPTISAQKIVKGSLMAKSPDNSTFLVDDLNYLVSQLTWDVYKTCIARVLMIFWDILSSYNAAISWHQSTRQWMEKIIPRSEKDGIMSQIYEVDQVNGKLYQSECKKTSLSESRNNISGTEVTYRSLNDEDKGSLKNIYNSLSQEERIYFAAVISAAENGLKESKRIIWDEMTRSLAMFVDSKSCLECEDFMQLVSWIQYFIMIGESFSGLEAVSLRSSLQIQVGWFFESLHDSNIEALDSMLSKESWGRLPFQEKSFESLKSSYSRNDMVNTEWLNCDQGEALYSDVGCQSLSKSNSFQEFLEHGNPWKRDTEEVEFDFWSLNKLKSYSTSVVKSTHRNLDRDLTENENATSGKVISSICDTHSISDVEIDLAATNSSLRLMKWIGEYIVLIWKLPDIEGIILNAILDLFDLYLLNIFACFEDASSLSWDGQENLDIYAGNECSVKVLRALLAASKRIHKHRTLLSHGNHPSRKPRIMIFLDHLLSKAIDSSANVSSHADAFHAVKASKVGSTNIPSEKIASSTYLNFSNSGNLFALVERFSAADSILTVAQYIKDMAKFLPRRIFDAQGMEDARDKSSKDCHAREKLVRTDEIASQTVSKHLDAENVNQGTYKDSEDGYQEHTRDNKAHKNCNSEVADSLPEKQNHLFASSAQSSLMETPSCTSAACAPIDVWIQQSNVHYIPSYLRMFLIQRCVLHLLPLKWLKQAVSMQNYCLVEPPSAPSEWTARLQQSLELLAAQIATSENSLPKDGPSLVWQEAAYVISRTIVDGACLVKSCTLEGRAGMSLDVSMAGKAIVKLVPQELKECVFEIMRFADDFVKAFYVPIFQLADWAASHPGYTKFQLLNLASCMAESSGLKKKDAAVAVAQVESQLKSIGL